ncbi:hypothetical protein [Actinomadura sp. SCN-SB]|uniref:hypothetical protein n=1 Tax=Actinomadura sp. SCN-SB TaxID=3373092 RepID=UPI0037530658
MPGSQHEALVELFHRDPELVARTLKEAFGVDVPPYTDARLDSGGLTEWAPTEYRADAVVVLESPKPVLAVVVEVQRTRDKAKRRSWPVYLTTLHARLECPTMLLVVCPDKAISRWCAKPIHTGHPGWGLSPLVYGPEQIPLVTDPAQAARDPDLATLSAIAHGDSPDGKGVLEVFAEALQAIDPAHRHRYTDIVFVALSEAARTYLEDLMNWQGYEYKSEFALRYFTEGEAKGLAKGEAKGEAKGLAEGLAKGEVDSLFRVLKARGIAVPARERQRIESCRDLGLLSAWIERAATATSLDEVFAHAAH